MRIRPPSVEPLNKRIRELREEQGLTQGQFAKKLGLTQGTITRYERGTADVPKYVIVAMEHIFHVNGRWLLFGESPKYIGEPKPLKTAELMGAAKQKGVIYTFLERLLKMPERVPGLKRM